MSYQSITVAGLTDPEQDTLNRLLKQLDAHRDYNLRREALYEMKGHIRHVSSVLPPQYQNMALSLGWIAKGVDGMAARCNIRAFTWADGDLEQYGLSTFEDDNHLLSELAMGRTSSLIHGPSFLVNTTGAEGEPASLLHARSALDATGDYNRRTRRMDSLVSVLETGDDEQPSEVVLYLPNLTITVAKDSGWIVTDRQDHSWGLPVEVLRYHPRERRPFGTSRISRAAISHQQAALRALARMEGHMDTYSWPESWLLGADESIFSDKSRMEVMLGRLKAIPDNLESGQDNQRADIKQFSASSPEPHITQLNTLAKLMSREFNLPDSSFALSDYSNPTSADSYTEGRDDLLADAEVAMDEWSTAIRRSVRRGLAIQNGDPDLFGALSGLEVQWRSPLHISRAAEADAGAKTLAAAPEWLKETRVGMELLGLSDDQIDRAMAEKRRASGVATLAAALAQPQVTDGAVGG